MMKLSGFVRRQDFVPACVHVAADEPSEILGSDTAPNPQELLITCMKIEFRLSNPHLVNYQIRI